MSTLSVVPFVHVETLTFHTYEGILGLPSFDGNPEYDSEVEMTISIERDSDGTGFGYRLDTPHAASAFFPLTEEQTHQFVEASIEEVLASEELMEKLCDAIHETDAQKWNPDWEGPDGWDADY